MVESKEQETSYTPINAREQAALAYAASGLYVLPLWPRSKVPATDHGVDDATTDQEIIREWWRENPLYNVGIATGHNLLILDADSPDAEAYLS
jgi:hypothetical protein